MRSIVFAAALAAGLGFAGAASADEALAQKSGCMTCHAVDAKKVGPSFKSIAAKFKGQADADKKLVEQLKAGKGHIAVKTSDADTATLVKWVLAM